VSSKLETLTSSAIDEFQKRSILEIGPGTYYASGKASSVGSTILSGIVFIEMTNRLWLFA
jgi:hypothetical protein